MKKPDNNFNKFIKYSSLAIEMAILITGCAYLGKYLDKQVETSKPFFTIGLSLFAVIGSVYLIIKRLLDDNK